MGASPGLTQGSGVWGGQLGASLGECLGFKAPCPQRLCREHGAAHARQLKPWDNTQCQEGGSYNLRVAVGGPRLQGWGPASSKRAWKSHSQPGDAATALPRARCAALSSLLSFSGHLFPGL